MSQNDNEEMGKYVDNELNTYREIEKVYDSIMDHVKENPSFGFLRKSNLRDFHKLMKNKGIKIDNWDDTDEVFESSKLEIKSYEYWKTRFDNITRFG